MKLIAFSSRNKVKALLTGHLLKQQDPHCDLQKKSCPMVADLEDSGSRSSREVSPASSTSITSVIIRVTTTRRQVSEPLPTTSMPAPEPSSMPAQSPTTIQPSELSEEVIEPDATSTPTPTPSSPPRPNGNDQRRSDNAPALPEPMPDIDNPDGATVTTSIEPDEPLTAPPMCRFHPTPNPMFRRSYIIRTRWNTPIPRFREFISSLPDRGNGVVLIVDSLPWQKYITMLSVEEADEARECDIVATVEPDGGLPLAEEITRQ